MNAPLKTTSNKRDKFCFITKIFQPSTANFYAWITKSFVCLFLARSWKTNCSPVSADENGVKQSLSRTQRTTMTRTCIPLDSLDDWERAFKRPDIAPLWWTWQSSLLLATTVASFGVQWKMVISVQLANWRTMAQDRSWGVLHDNNKEK